MRSFCTILVTLALLALAACSACETPSPVAEPVARSKAAAPPDGDTPQLEGPIPYGSIVIIHLDEPPEDGRFPLIHLFRSISPRARACSVKPGLQAIVVGELRHNDAYYLKVRTPKCSGYIRDNLVKVP